jgi:hypothetical protein
MQKTLMLALGAGFLATATLQSTEAALAAKKGGEKGINIGGGKAPKTSRPNTSPYKWSAKGGGNLGRTFFVDETGVIRPPMPPGRRPCPNCLKLPNR